MPHLIVDSVNASAVPAKIGEFEFEFFAKNPGREGEAVVGVNHPSGRFLLLLKRKKEGIIVKSDKITRICPNFILKQALMAFAKAAGSEILYSNISVIREQVKEGSKFLKEPGYFASGLNLDREIWIEIGFGSGRHLLHQAKKHPAILFIGLEIHKPSIEQVLRQLELQGIGNVLVVDYDARLFLEFLPSNAAGRIFVHFPVPWDKKPHRRVFSFAFVQEAARVLKKGGTLELRTDSREYFDFAFRIAMEGEHVHAQAAKNMDLEISSKYEDRWRKMGKDIYDLKLISHEDSEPLAIRGDFGFGPFVSLDRIREKFTAKPQLFDGFFYHLDHIYAIDSHEGLVRLSLGACDRPENLYILFKDGRIGYYPKEPLLSPKNLMAHQKIREWIHD